MKASLKKLLATLVALALVAGIPAAALAAAAAGVSCDTAAAAEHPANDCCEEREANAGNTKCSTACAVSLTALSSPLFEALPALPGVAVFIRHESPVQALSGPPDTAPPKLRHS